jgi:hypothetical protein
MAPRRACHPGQEAFMHRLFQAFSMFVVATLTGVSGAFAAPQILALIETPEPTPLVCSNGVCQAEFVTMCLQRERELPKPGTAYAPATASSVVLVLYRADGTTARVENAPGLRFVVPRSYLSAMASVPETELARHGATRAALEIAPLASLVPEPVANDTNPLTVDEIAAVTGTARLTAKRVLEHAPETAFAVRAANRFANAMLVNRVKTRDARLALWRDVVAASPEAVVESGIAQVRRIIDTCQFYDEHSGFEGFRGCVQYRRDLMLDRVNDTYWRRKDLGS